MDKIQGQIMLLNFSWSLSYREKLREDFPVVYEQLLGELNKVKRPSKLGDVA